MRLLIIHQNFPGQFGYFAKAWAERPGWHVTALADENAPGLPGFGNLLRYRPARKPGVQQHPYLRQMEQATLRGQAVLRVLLGLRKRGYQPDVILAHPGWGETLYVKEAFPDARLIHYCEWFYGGEDADVGFDPEFPASVDDRARVRTWNALHTLNLVNCDAGISPTQWQRSRHPKEFLEKIAVQHEGIAFDELAPAPTAAIKTPNGTVLKAGDPVITYVARNLEPYRGFHVFMRALQRIQQQHSTCQAVIVGGDEVSYGRRPQDASNWREHMLREVKLDPQRTHFMGRLPRADYIRVLQVSAAHVYLTYPFVLSWSVLEAMACGALVIGSDTAPVREVIQHGSNGLRVPFFDIQALSSTVLDAMQQSERLVPLGHAARRYTESRFSRERGLKAYERQIFKDTSPPVPLESLQCSTKVCFKAF